MLHAPFVNLKEELKTFPVFIIVKKKMLVTWGEEEAHGHSTIVKSTIRRLREHVEDGGKPNSPLAISMLLREIACNNSAVMLSIKEQIDGVEERVLDTGEKPATRVIFELKRNVHKVYRLLVNEREFLADINERMIPRVQMDEKAESIVDDAMEIVNRELGFVDAYDRALDSILTLQDLTSIHKVESSINYLTIILVIGTVILIILEVMGKLGIPAGH
jgi:Mg2+ and Co2+ transporter CorA